VLVLAFAWSDLAYAALSVFLVAVGLSLAFAFLRLGGTLGRVSAFIKGAESEILPLIAKVGGTVDRVNGQLDKVDLMTDSAVDAVQSVDSAVRAVSFAVTRPVRKISGVTAGLTHGASELRASRDWRSAVAAGKDAAARRERELDEELREAEKGPPAP
jgi:uncharacterized protein YoxC